MDEAGAIVAKQRPGRLVLIAPDKFKGSLSAPSVASAIATGIGRARPDVAVDLCPVADGGEGTLEAAISAGFRRVQAEVEGPTGEPVRAAYGERDGVALVELAEAVGLGRLADDRLAPLTASTYGAGQLVDAAIRAGNKTIVLAIGGSATSDGGAGLVEALGAELLDIDGKPLSRGGGALTRIDQINFGSMRDRLAKVKFIIASDVTSPLLGPKGAAVVFGPQKGASVGDVYVLERGLTRWAEVITAATEKDVRDRPGAGAAGGVGFGAMALLNASIVPGAELILEMVDFAQRARRSSLVITGEGSFDEQTLFGKAPIRVAAAAQEVGTPVVAVVGRCTLPEATFTPLGIHKVYELGMLEPDLSRSMANAESLIVNISERVAVTELNGL
ncbi:MAG TPA: glycerate kinase [Streptosporangiaceae bacterium]